MQPMYNTKYNGHLPFFSKACILFILFQVVSCKCGNNPGKDGDEAGGSTTQQTDQNKPTLTLTGPAEVKNNPTQSAPTVIILKLEVTNGTLNTSDYKLEAIDLKNYEQADYTFEQDSISYYTKVSGANHKTLQTLTGNPTLTKNDKIQIPISVVVSKWYTHHQGQLNELVVPFSESAKFQFAILDNANNQVAGPIEVKWTRDIS